MAQEAEVNSRPDVDIEEDLMDVFTLYPPLAHDRSRMKVTVEDGVVRASGHVKTDQSREIFAREAGRIEGVRDVDVSELYDDETIRIQAGQFTPYGVFASVSYGAVVLTGRVPDGLTVDAIAEQVQEKIEGVRTVIPNF